LYVRTLATRAAGKSGWRLTTREVAVQRWPLVAKAPHATPSTVSSRSASGITMVTFFEPSSIE